MRFHNSDYKKMVNQAKSLTIEEKKEIVSNYPAAENALIALIMLIKSGADVDDWECDFSEIVWPEVEKNK